MPKFVLWLASASSKLTVLGITCFLKIRGHDPPLCLRKCDGLRHEVTAALSGSDSFLSCCSSLGEAWAQVKKSLADEAEVHLKFSAKVIPLHGLSGLVLHRGVFLNV